MHPPPPDSPQPQRTVLDLVLNKSGVAPKVLLSDSDSEAGSSPIVDPGHATAKLVPQGRGNYQLLGEIARGGMGVILKGHDTDLGRDVAVKVLGKEMSSKPAIVQRFIEEAQIGGQLQHPGIVPVYELGVMSDDRPFFTMKLVKGRTLAALIAQRKTLAEDRGKLLSIFESVCQTMAYAHNKGVLHRDLKPSNVMVGAFGEVQVVDWGLSKVLRRGGDADERRARDSVHTVIETVRSGPRGAGSSGSDSLAGSVMGTPAYMAPEQAQGEVESLDERADVFSLGAILCELLTGRPPYVEGQGQDGSRDGVIVQAARAMLGPARERLEASGADPALKELCLECMLPSRAARPANADAVAKAVRAHLTSVEERAHEAELAAAEARIKAAEERRVRRMAVALAGMIALAVIGGSGSFLWVSRERAKRIEQTREAVDAACGESIEQSSAGLAAEALASARRALALAESGGADAVLIERTRSFVAKAEADVGSAARERQLLEQDERLLSRLIDLRVEQIATTASAIGDPDLPAKLDAEFVRAFKDYGVDVEGSDVVPVLERFRERAVAEEVALALDDWGRLRRRVRGRTSEEAENLLVLAMDLDPDPHRTRLRQAIAEGDRRVLLELAAAESLSKLGPGSICVLCAALWGSEWSGLHPEVFEILRQALRLYPGDFMLQAVAGSYFEDSFQFEESLACRQAALSLRPTDRGARRKVGGMLLMTGRLSEARHILLRAAAEEPSSAEALDNLGYAELLLGDHAAALAAFTSTPTVMAEPLYAPDVLLGQFYNGVLTKEEFTRYVDGEFNAQFLGIYLFGLLDHPDPKQRDPRLVLRTLEERAPILSGWGWPAVAETVARVRIEDWPGALAVLEGSFNWPSALPEPSANLRRPPLILMTPVSFPFLAALVHARAGHAEQARQYYKHAMVAWNLLTRDEPAAWERSDAMRWRREAEAALAK